ncbi:MULTISPECIES: SHOCT domain-containing protein [Stenotrophomonas]|jgi:flagellar biosynthesis/type III secretory pathway M-ring protein FliF/YscJ|uniref:SHOCT domain-containing protein n=1 Tax=Stenotrophomonas aracearum TaxID=3003272 RepID=A0ABY9YCI3_9GAMM|nr:MULTISPECIES: SHOCT domain-containing protein [unclassified Stenotrophomonas]WNH48567.1 SHOCT domain-containing protein [Stenotrophomonas sp. A5588]
MQTMGWVQWLTWGTGVTVFAVVIALVIRSAVRASKRAPEQPSAAARLAREANLSPAVQADLAALNRRKDNGEISEAEYEQQRAALLRAG